MSKKQINSLPVFDRVMYRYGHLLKVMTGEKAIYKRILDLLDGVSAINWDTGLSSKQIAKCLDFSIVQVQSGISKLLSRNKIKKLKRGRRVRYVLT